jgi:hypothetical protein
MKDEGQSVISAHGIHHVVVNRAFIVGALPKLRYFMKTPSDIPMFPRCGSHLL